ncbi:hypothetical protein C9374_002882 [Naegleria lovaniensis]|uniref:Uncharacterized protein n=1 Tax=Naegleria lovaniensis TaxID=51637 RepID=A0AA88KKF9_NAELO|nr:uncharacterized protein C9374_002882 [Naegleria lovaniensis]KAG2385733.1 hypothetical protein C9374_002882 [Naegleria lovaniensis]
MKSSKIPTPKQGEQQQHAAVDNNIQMFNQACRPVSPTQVATTLSLPPSSSSTGLSHQLQLHVTTFQDNQKQKEPPLGLSAVGPILPNHSNINNNRVVAQTFVLHQQSSLNSSMSRSSSMSYHPSSFSVDFQQQEHAKKHQVISKMDAEQLSPANDPLLMFRGEETVKESTARGEIKAIVPPSSMMHQHVPSTSDDWMSSTTAIPSSNRPDKAPSMTSGSNPSSLSHTRPQAEQDHKYMAPTTTSHATVDSSQTPRHPQMHESVITTGQHASHSITLRGEEDHHWEGDRSSSSNPNKNHMQQVKSTTPSTNHVTSKPPPPSTTTSFHHHHQDLTRTEPSQPIVSSSQNLSFSHPQQQQQLHVPSCSACVVVTPTNNMCLTTTTNAAKTFHTPPLAPNTKNASGRNPSPSTPPSVIMTSSFATSSSQIIPSSTKRRQQASNSNIVGGNPSPYETHVFMSNEHAASSVTSFTNEKLSFPKVNYYGRFYELKDELGMDKWPQFYDEIRHLPIFPFVYPMSFKFILNPPKLSSFHAASKRKKRKGGNVNIFFEGGNEEITKEWSQHVISDEEVRNHFFKVCTEIRKFIDESVIEKIRYLTKCSSQKEEVVEPPKPPTETCPTLNSDLKCNKETEKRVVRLISKNGKQCPVYVCKKRKVEKCKKDTPPPEIKCPDIFQQDQQCKEGYEQVTRQVQFGDKLCDRKVCVRNVPECPKQEFEKCPDGQTRKFSTNPVTKCPEMTCVPLECPKEFDPKNVKCSPGWVLSQVKVKYGSIECSEYKCVNIGCPAEIRETRNIKCKQGQVLKSEDVIVNGRKCPKFRCVDVTCPLVEEPKCAAGDITIEVKTVYHGILCKSFKCVHEECPNPEMKSCDPESEQLQVVKYSTNSGKSCYKYECVKRKKTCSNVCTRYSERAGKCLKYVMQGEQQKCISWDLVNQGQCIEQRFINKCKRYVAGGQTCVKKGITTSCLKEELRKECTKYGEKEICVSSSSTAKRTCQRYDTRVVGCLQYKAVSKCVSRTNIPQTECKPVRQCLKQLAPTQTKYCKAYKKQCKKAKRETCTTTTCPCSKKPIKKCRTVYFDACCENKCSEWATRTVKGKCAEWGTRRVCKPSNKPTSVCSKYQTVNICVQPKTEKICTKWHSTSGGVCTQRKKISVCLSSKSVKTCTKYGQKEVCESWGVTKPRCAEYASTSVCVKDLQVREFVPSITVDFLNSELQVFMKGVVFPLPKRVALRTNFSYKETMIENIKQAAGLQIDIKNQLIFTRTTQSRYVVLDAQTKEIKNYFSLPLRRCPRNFKICQNDNSILVPLGKELWKYRYSVPKILTGAQEDVVQHVWTFQYRLISVLDSITIDYDDDAIDHHGSGVIYVCDTLSVFVVNGFNGQLVKKLGAFNSINGVTLDGNRNLIICRFDKNHQVVTRNGDLLNEIAIKPNYFVLYILHDPSTNNLILVLESELTLTDHVVQIISPRGELIIEKATGFDVDGMCLNERTGELLLVHKGSIEIYQ